MTTESLDREIERVSLEFRRLNGLRYCNADYRLRTRNVEKLITRHADTLARLRRFRNYLVAKKYCEAI